MPFAAKDSCPVPTTTFAEQDSARTNASARPKGRRGWSVGANAGAVVSAFVASACCVGPLVLALLGLGGGALLVKFEPYRPYFMAITFALLGAGFWLQYRKPRVAVAEGDSCDCPAPRANRTGKIMLWVASVVVAGFLAFPYLAPALFG